MFYFIFYGFKLLFNCGSDRNLKQHSIIYSYENKTFLVAKINRLRLLNVWYLLRHKYIHSCWTQHKVRCLIRSELNRKTNDSKLPIYLCYSEAE